MEDSKPSVARENRSGVKPCVAVLPFENRSDDAELDYFCEGIAAEILICLARTPGIRVVARSAIFSVDWDALDIREAGKLLEATAILKGSVRKAATRRTHASPIQGDELTVMVDLIDVETGRDLWSRRFRRDFLDVFVVQDAIVGGVVRALAVDVDDSRVRKIRERHATNVDAYKLYLRGRHFYWQFSRKGIEKALELFRRATTLDGEYALAYCGQTDCYWYLFSYVESKGEYRKKAGAASRRALELAPELAEAHTSRGLALSLGGRFDDAAAEFERAIALDPMLFEARFLYARCCFAEGQIEKAARLFEESNRIRPEDYQSLLLAGQAYEVLGNAKRAREMRQHGVAIADEHLFLNPRETRALYMGANGLMALGETERGLAWLQRARALEPEDPMLLYNAACIYALVGEKTEAFNCLEQAVKGGLRQKGWFQNDPNLDSIRSHSRFIALEAALL